MMNFQWFCNSREAGGGRGGMEMYPNIPVIYNRGEMTYVVHPLGAEQSRRLPC